MNWSPEQYSKFEQERNRPVWDLLAQVSSSSVTDAVDIGCGPGNSTEILQDRFPEARITGLDSSAEMIEVARKRVPNARFQLATIQEWTDPGPFDLIVASAALHWVPNHEFLLPSLVDKLSDDGSLAVQIPDNLNEPVHRAISEIAASGPWYPKLTLASRMSNDCHSADWYYDTLNTVTKRVKSGAQRTSTFFLAERRKSQSGSRAPPYVRCSHNWIPTRRLGFWKCFRDQ